LLPQGPESTFHYYYYHLRVMKLTSKGLYCGSFVLLLERGAKTREGRVSYLQLSLGPLKIKRPTVPRLFSYPDSNLVVAPLMMGHLGFEIHFSLWELLIVDFILSNLTDNRQSSSRLLLHSLLKMPRLLKPATCALTAVMFIFLIFCLSVAPTKLSARNEVSGDYGLVGRHQRLQFLGVCQKCQ